MYILSEWKNSREKFRILKSLETSIDVLFDTFLFRGTCELRMISSFRLNLRLSLCLDCSDPLKCLGNAHTLRYILTVLKYMRQMRLTFGPGAAQSLYRIIGHPLTMTFINRFCQVTDAPSDATPYDIRDRFYRPRIIPSSETGLRDLTLRSDLNIVFCATDVFGMPYSKYVERMNNPDVRLRTLKMSD